MPEPIYTPKNTNPAYQLNWGLTIFWRDDPWPEGDWLQHLKDATEPDGVRVLKHSFRNNNISLFFVSTRPEVAPKDLIRSVKGRLQHRISREVPKAFQRNYWLRSIGTCTRSVIEEYVESQVERYPEVDPRLEERLDDYSRSYPEVDLSQVRSTAHGRFWYNVHLVLANDGRVMEVRDEILRGLLGMAEGIVRKHEYLMSRLSVLPEHVHLTLGLPIDESPQEVACRFMNNLAYVHGMERIFPFSYYVGTFGEYDRGAV